MQGKSATSESEPARSTLGIRARLMILAVVAILPLLADRLHDIEVDRTARIEETYRQAHGLARQAMTLQNEVFVTARAFLQVAANAYVTGQQSCEEFVRSNAGQLPWMKSISVVRPDGIVICASREQSVGVDISRLSHFLRVTENGQFALGDYFYAFDIGPSIFAAHAHRDASGKIDAIVSANLDIDWFARLTAMVGEQHDSIVMLFDGAGTMLARYPSHADPVGRQYKDHPMVQTFLSKSEGIFTGEAIDGVRRVFGYAQLPGTSARFAIGFDEADVLRRIDNRTWTSIAQLGVFTLIVLISIWFGGERMFVRPIRQMAERAQRLGRGEVEPRQDSGRFVAELVPLAAALDDMVGQLSAREQELQDRNDQLHELARIDGLTGLANRGAFNSRLTFEWQTAADSGRPLGLLMVDVDHFKSFNDRYGHIQGDACLREIAGALKASARIGAIGSAKAAMPGAEIRGNDLAARYGGEEFAVLLLGATFDTCMLVAERLRKAVQDLQMKHANAPLGIVTISIGVASVVPARNESAQHLLEAADAGLYAAKRHGRNKVMARAPALMATPG